MKKSIWSAALIFTILFSCSISAQQVSTLMDNSQVNVQGSKAKNYEQIAKRDFDLIPASLDSKIPGIVESTIYNLITEKRYYPSADYSEMIDKLNRIAEENSDPSLRAKAHLAIIYLSTSSLINVEPDFNSYDHNYIYKQITEQLENNVLVQK